MGFFSGIARVISSAVSSVASTVSTNLAKKGGIKGIFSAGIKQFAISFIASAVFSFAYKKLAGKPKLDTPQTFDTEVTRRSTIIRNPIQPRQVVYGTVKKSGVLLYASTSSTSSTSDNKFLNLVIALASHEIQSVTKIYFNDTEIPVSALDGNGNVTSGTYSGKAKIKINLGSDNQNADSDLVSEDSNITSAHRFRGIAYLYCRLEFDEDVYPNGIPNISALISGKKVLDFRTNTTAFSSNPALIIYNYLTSSDGMGASTSEIDTTSFTTSANNCDTDITITGGTQNRYECHGVVNLDQKPIDVIDDILSSCVGILTYEQGLFKLKVGVATSSVKTITENDLMNEINVRTKPKRQELYNQVRGTFADESQNYIATDFPIKESTSYQTSDGEVIAREINLPFTTNVVMAERIALILLKQSRNMITLNFTGKATLLNLSVGDVVQISLSKLGFTNKTFQVTSFTINENLTCQLTLQEYESTIYDFNASTEQATLTTPNSINLPNAFSVTAPTNLVLGDELRIANEGIVVSVLTASATISDDAFVGRYECQFKKTTDSDFTVVGIATSPKFDIHGIIDGLTYDVKIRAINNLGAKSSFLSGQHTVIGGQTPPDDVTDFGCNIVGKDAFLGWEAVTNLDLAEYQIRYSTLTTGAEWQNSVSLVEKVSRPATSITVPARVGSYLIKARDKSGNYSANATIVSTNITEVGNFNVIATQQEHPNFSGSKTNVTLSNNAIRLTNISAQTGIYEFSQVVDVSAIVTSRVTATITQFSEDPTDLFDSKSGLFDSASGLFDGDAPQNQNAHLEIAVSNDNINYSNFQNFVVGDYTARYYKFRAVLISRDNQTTPVISALSVSVDLEDIIQSGNDIVSGSSTKSVTFAKPFYNNQYALGITAQGLSTGDYYLLQNKSTTGFDITFKNSSGTDISKTFDYLSKGF